MKRFLILTLGVLVAFHSHAGPQTAHARLFCVSLRFQQGATQFGSTLDLSTLPTSSSPNGELAPTFASPTHYSGFALNDVTSFETIYGTIAFDLPLDSDANQNGFADALEVSQGISATTTGSYEVPGVDQGNVTAKWSRPSGSKDGTCTLNLSSTARSVTGSANTAS